MHIISKFTDYYDVGISYGVDRAIKYHRALTEVTSRFDPSYIIINKSRRHVLFTGYLGYCGQIFPYVTLVDHTHLSSKLYDVKEYRRYANLGCKCIFSYTNEQLDTAIRTIEENTQNNRRHTNASINKTLLESIVYYKDDLRTFLDANHNSKQFLDIFDQYRVPIFDICSNALYINSEPQKIVLNPFLKEMEFYKIKTPIAAFQEIMQYVSGVLGGTSPDIVHIDDKSQLLKKGFDIKYSFRKRPEKAA